MFYDRSPARTYSLVGSAEGTRGSHSGDFLGEMKTVYLLQKAARTIQQLPGRAEIPACLSYGGVVQRRRCTAEQNSEVSCRNEA